MKIETIKIFYYSKKIAKGKQIKLQLLQKVDDDNLDKNVLKKLRLKIFTKNEKPSLLLYNYSVYLSHML